MAYEHKPNRGAIFPNDRKDNPRAPEWRGDIMLPDGTVMALAGWRTKNGAGISLVLSEKRGGTAPAQPPKPKAGAFDDLEDDLPF